MEMGAHERNGVRAARVGALWEKGVGLCEGPNCSLEGTQTYFGLPLSPLPTPEGHCR